MGIWPNRRIIESALNGVDVKATAAPVPTAARTTTGQVVPVSGIYDSPVDRATALSLPSLKRAVELKASTLAGLPLVRYDKAGNRFDAGWIEQIEPGRPRFNTMLDLAFDLIFENVAYLRIHDRDNSGRPRLGGCEYVALHRVTPHVDTNGKPALRIDGQPVAARDVIGFSGTSPTRNGTPGRGILVDGARTIRIGLALEAAARRYADKPRPSERLVNKGGYELSDAEVDELLLNYAAGLNGEGITYSNSSIDVVQVGWDAKALQLIEARQYNALQIANLVGVNADMVDGAAATSGGNVHYSNITQDFRRFVQTSLKLFAYPIEGRLSLGDVSDMPVQFDFDALTRGDPLERAQVYQILIPLGVLSVEEARRLEDLSGGNA